MKRSVVLVVVAFSLSPRAQAGDVGPAPGEGQPPWNGETFRHVTDDASGTTFDLPLIGFRLETRHFDDKASEVKHAFTLWGPGGLEVMVEAFANPEGAPLERFLDAHLAFMKTPHSAVTGGVAGARNVAALFLEERRSRAPTRSRRRSSAWAGSCFA